jgi:hypothetical protein
MRADKMPMLALLSFRHSKNYNFVPRIFMTAETFLPFSRPTIDEETIANVGDVLRSGWITTDGNRAAHCRYRQGR